MQGDISSGPIKGERQFIRIPVALSAKAFVGGQFYADVVITNLSATGLSLHFKGGDDFPNISELQFSLLPSVDIVKIKVELKNKVVSTDGLRVGCRFCEISEKNKQVVDDYIIKSVDLSLTWKIFNITSFIVCLDAVLRIFMYLTYNYYAGTLFGKSISMENLSHLYGVILALYVLTAFGALLLSSNIWKKSFTLKIFCLVPPFIFLIVKSIMYLELYSRAGEYTQINAFLITYLMLTFCAGVALEMGRRALKKRSFILEILSAHKG